MASKEKGSQESCPIPNTVRQDTSESIASPFALQVSRLSRLYAVNGAMAEAIAPLVFLEMVR